MPKGSIKISTGKPKGIRNHHVVTPVSAESSDTNSLIVFQRLLERNPDFNSDPELYRGKIEAVREGVYALPFDVLISTGEGKQDRDFVVFDRLIKSLIDGLKANEISCYSL